MYATNNDMAKILRAFWSILERSGFPIEHLWIVRELKQHGDERERERYKTIDLIAEYNNFTWERNQLTTFLSSLETEREKLNFGVLLRTWTWVWIVIYFVLLKNEATSFFHSHTFVQNQMKRMSYCKLYTNKKKEKGKLEIQQPSAFCACTEPGVWGKEFPLVQCCCRF